jgi:uncharacterized metal-binding protein YceD (DUF177 family)
MSRGEGHAETHGFRRLLAVRKVGDNGLAHEIDASGEELSRLAGFLDVVAVKDLRASFRISRWRTRGIKLEGSLTAGVVQACVVTLEPVESSVEARFERRYLPAEMLDPAGEGDDVFVDPEGEDPPEPLTHELDLGEIVVEELALNIDPYPRKAGIVFATSTDDDGRKPPANPFAALARLKGRLGPKT